MGLRGLLSSSGQASDFESYAFVKDLAPFLALASAFIQDLDGRISSKVLDDVGRVLVALLSLASAGVAVVLTCVIFFETTDVPDVSFRHMLPGRWGAKKPQSDVLRNTLLEILLGFKLLIPLAVATLSVLSTRVIELRGYNYDKADLACVVLTYGGGFAAHAVRWIGNTRSVRLGRAVEEAEDATRVQ